ncbi:phage holin family protein [Serratia quinivorans]|jgi:cation transport ATPase|uniref:phage holin family protein n=1 Tax=Serratia quinivorans TaxID=137545 RepID=UPI001C44712C|nr:phage holin family protein [Serratia quinivorans]MBV6694746.1 phage holin family protein [Serratia quinivorans]
MSSKEPTDPDFCLWIVMMLLSAWGGLVKYLIRINYQHQKWSWIEVTSQLIISGFTGLLGGILSIENGASNYMTLFFSGLFGAMGSAALTYFWQRLFPS